MSGKNIRAWKTEAEQWALYKSNTIRVMKGLPPVKPSLWQRFKWWIRGIMK